MTNLETNFLEVLTCENIHFCSRAVLMQIRTALIWDFHQRFRKEVLAGPYGSYDKNHSFTLGMFIAQMLVGLSTCDHDHFRCW